MQIQWVSQRGSKRRANHDAAGIGIGHNRLVAVLTDACERRQPQATQSPTLANYWCGRAIQSALTLGEHTDVEQLIQSLQQEQRLLRHDYLLEIASYCLVTMTLDSGNFTALHCGDCLTGTLEFFSGDARINWLHTPHSLHQHYKQVEASAERAKHGYQLEDERQVLTRCLNARRFEQPEIVTGTLASGSHLILATDGYWANDNQDDSSAITISMGSLNIHLDSDCDNLLVYPKELESQLKGRP